MAKLSECWKLLRNWTNFTKAFTPGYRSVLTPALSLTRCDKSQLMHFLCDDEKKCTYPHDDEAIFIYYV